MDVKNSPILLCFLKRSLTWQLLQYNLTTLFRVKLETAKCYESHSTEKTKQTFWLTQYFWTWRSLYIRDREPCSVQQDPFIPTHSTCIKNTNNLDPRSYEKDRGTKDLRVERKLLSSSGPWQKSELWWWGEAFRLPHPCGGDPWNTPRKP